MNNKNLKLLFFKKDASEKNYHLENKNLTTINKDKNPINTQIIGDYLKSNLLSKNTFAPTEINEHINNTILINNLVKIKNIPIIKNIEDKENNKDGLEDNKEGLEDNKKGLVDNKEGLEDSKEGLEDKKEGLENNKEGLEVNKEGLENSKEGLEVNKEGLENSKESLENSKEDVVIQKTKTQEILDTLLQNIDNMYDQEKNKKLEELEKMKNDFLTTSETNRNSLKKYIKSKLENCKIPLVIYQTWMTKSLPDKMMKTVDKMKKNNPEFEYKLFDDDDCRKFIIEHFNNNVLYAYDNLVPGAFKADLWRYCVLYINGGIYIDIKYEPVNNFKLIDIVDKDYFVLDRPTFFGGHVGIYNGFITSQPNNVIFLKLINAIVDNVKNKYYGTNPLSVTGPSLVGKMLYPNNEKCTINISKEYDLKYTLDGLSIEYKGNKILTQYGDYRKDQIKFTKTTYHILWEKRKIFKN